MFHAGRTKRKTGPRIWFPATNRTQRAEVPSQANLFRIETLADLQQSGVAEFIDRIILLQALLAVRYRVSVNRNTQKNIRRSSPFQGAT